MPSYEDLESRIIDPGECTVCGACIVACPSFHIKFINGRPRRPKRNMDCVGCSICYEACYMLRHDLIKEIEGNVIGRARVKSIGLYRRVVTAKTTKADIGDRCQDGGIVTTVLLHALHSHVIDGALVVAGDAWAPTPYVATTPDDMINAAGTRYGVVPVLIKLREAVVDHGLRKICVVGSPCHIQSIRYLKYRGLPLAASVKLTVGLFCRENYEYDCIAYIVRSHGVEMSDVDRLGVYDDFIINTDGRRLSLPITEIKNCVPRQCLVCSDFAAELADLAVGSGGSAEGWSTVIIRTEAGERVFADMERHELAETEAATHVSEIVEIAERKKHKAKQTGQIFRLQEKGHSRKEIAATLAITEERVSHRLDGAGHSRRLG